MKAPSLAPAYASLFPGMSEIARKHGYALTIHGSLQTDLDLLAVPWEPTAASAEQLVTAFRDYLNVIVNDHYDGSGRPVHVPEHKPHGRVAYLLPFGHGAVVDLSVMPIQKTPAEQVVFDLVSVLRQAEETMMLVMRDQKDLAKAHEREHRVSALDKVLDQIKSVFEVK